MSRPSARTAVPRPAKRAVGRTDKFRSWRRLSAAAALAVLAVGAIPGSAQNTARVASEQGVKAAYLFKFPAYVDWPESAFEAPDSAVSIGVIEDERLADELEAITAGHTVRGRPIRVLRLAADDSLAGVHVLFVSSRERRSSEDGPQYGEQPILTVADFGGAGIVLTFLPIDGRLRFEVDLAEARRRGLRLHSGLLAVAERVRGAPP